MERLSVLDVPYSAVANSFPEAAPIEGGFSVPWELEVIQRLYGIGIDLIDKCPIYQWQWPKVYGEQLRPDQKQTAASLVTFRRGFCLSPPRMGKTAATVAASLYLLDTQKIKRVLIIAVLSAFYDWRRHLFTMRPGAPILALHGKTRNAIKTGEYKHYRFLMINPDGFRYIGDDVKRLVDAGEIECIVVDELTEWSNSTAKRWRAAYQATRAAKYLWGITGTPGDPLQIYGQVKFVGSFSALPKSFTSWRTSVAVQRSQFVWETTPAGWKIAERALTPAIRIRKEDVFKQMQVFEEFVRTPLSQHQKTAIEKLQKETAMILPCGSAIDAAQKSAMVTKILQICGGAVLIDEGQNAVYFDIAGRLDVLEHIIRHKSETKCIVFVQFREVMRHLEKKLRDRQLIVESINGEVPPSHRTEIIRRFDTDPDLRVLLLHPVVARYSLELAAADTCVFWGPCLSGTFSYEQARNRILSGKQKSKTPTIVHLYSSPIEHALHKKIKIGIAAQTALLEAFETAISEGAINDE